MRSIQKKMSLVEQFQKYNLLTQQAIITHLEPEVRCCEPTETLYLNLVPCHGCGVALCPQKHGTYCSFEKSIVIDKFNSCFKCQDKVFQMAFHGKRIEEKSNPNTKIVERFCLKFGKVVASLKAEMFDKMEEMCRCLDNYNDLPAIALVSCHKCKKNCCQRNHKCTYDQIISITPYHKAEIFSYCSCVLEMGFTTCKDCTQCPKTGLITLCYKHSSAM